MTTSDSYKIYIDIEISRGNSQNYKNALLKPAGRESLIKKKTKKLNLDTHTPF